MMMMDHEGEAASTSRTRKFFRKLFCPESRGNRENGFRRTTRLLPPTARGVHSAQRCESPALIYTGSTEISKSPDVAKFESISTTSELRINNSCPRHARLLPATFAVPGISQWPECRNAINHA